MSAVTLNRITLVLAIIGLFIAGVLSYSHLINYVPPCGPSGGCEKVAIHPSSYWFGIPVAYFGFGAYLTMVALAIMRGLKGPLTHKKLAIASFAVTASGVVVSIFLTYYSITVINATCLWCMGSLVTMILSFFFTAALAQKDAEVTPGSTLDLKLGVGLIIIAMIGVGVVGIAMKKEGVPLVKLYENAPEDSFVPPRAHIMGNKNAPITIVEFGDLLCPACKAHFVDMTKFANESNGRIRFVFRHFPMFQIREHRMSYQGAVLSEIASESDKFWPYLTGVYQFPNEEVSDVTPFAQVLDNLQIPSKKAIDRSTDIKDPAFMRVYNDMKDGNHLGVNGTPTFFVLAPGVKPKAVGFQDLKNVLDSEPYKSVVANAR